jgi:hypothetical protein
MSTWRLRLFSITAPETQRPVYRHTLSCLRGTRLNLLRYLSLSSELMTNPTIVRLRRQKFTKFDVDSLQQRRRCRYELCPCSERM